MKTKLLKRLPLNQLMDLKVDYAFKQLFGTEKNKDLTVVFLNAILQRSGKDRIQEILLNSTEAGGEYDGDKQSRLDILARTNRDEWVNIEIQFTNQYDMVKRSIYYWAGVYRGPMTRGMGYRQLNPVIAITITNFDMFKETDRFHTSYQLYEDTDRFKLTDVMSFHFLEMTKLIRDWKADKLDPWNDVLARWLLLLGIVDHRNGHVYEDIYKELEGIAMKDDTLKNAFQGWEMLSASEEEVFQYEARLKRVLDEEAARKEVELREEEAKQRGEEEGEARGMKQGRQAERVSMVKKLLLKGIKAEEVAQMFDFDIEDVKRIERETNA